MDDNDILPHYPKRPLRYRLERAIRKMRYHLREWWDDIRMRWC